MKNKREIGITLVALIVTIIILLILAGIAIVQLTDNGLFENAKIAKEKYENAQELENEKLAEYNEALEGKDISKVDGTRDGNTEKESSIISNISFEANPRTNSAILNITTTATGDVIGYHAFAIDDNDSSKIYASVTSSNEIVINGLSVNTKYKVYVIGYDKYNNYKKSEISEVTTKYEEKLIPTLTSNTSAGGTAFATYTGNGRSAWEAFDGIIPTSAAGSVPGYMVSGTTTNQIGYDFGEGNSKVVTKIIYYNHPGDRNVKYSEITLQYSDDGTNYTDVQTFNPEYITTYTNVSDLAQELTVTSTQSRHRYWRISGTNTGYSWSGLLELEFWGN